MLDALVERRTGSNASRMYTVSPAIWEAQAHKGIYSGVKFIVDVGTNMDVPRIVKDDAGLPKNRVINVPVEYKHEFEKDIFAALRDLAGIRVRFKDAMEGE